MLSRELEATPGAIAERRKEKKKVVENWGVWKC
jgi:hypothetical protein